MVPPRSFPVDADSRLDSRDYLWLGLTCALILAFAFLLPVHPNDYWWYLRLGGEIWNGGSIPQVETWSVTRAGQPVIHHPWLAAVVFYALDRAGGISAVVFVRGLSLVGYYTFIYLASRREGAGPRLAAGMIVLAVLVGSSNWGVRPQMLTYPLFGIGLWILVCWHNGTSRWLWLLPFVGVLWVNLHGSFPLLFLLAGAALLGGKGNRRKLAAALAITLLVSLLNPRGWGAWSYFAHMLADPSVRGFSSEWKPVALDGWQSGIFFAWLLASIPLAAYSSRRLPAVYWLWCLGFGWLALSGVRNVIWFSAILAVLSAAWLAAWLPRGSPNFVQPARPRINYATGTILVIMTFLFLPGLRQRWWSHAPPDYSPDTPVQAVDWMLSHPELEGWMWNDLDFSSYLIYALPERLVWIDTRFEVYSKEDWEHYQTISAAGPGWEEWFEDQNIGVVFANVRTQPALINGLRSLPDWCMRYVDSTAAIFSRTVSRVDCPASTASLQGIWLNPVEK